MSSTLSKKTESVPAELKSREWRLNNLYKVENKDGELVTFKMNSVQLELFRNLHFRNIVLKARQIGSSTFCTILFLDECLFRRNRKCAIVADKLENATKLFKKMETAWKGLDPDIKEYLGLTLKSDSKTYIEFSNGSSVQVGTTLHSGTYQLVLLSEYGPLCANYPEKAEIVKKSGLPTVPNNGLLIIESTAEGEGNDFHDLCTRAQDRKEKRLPMSNLDYKFFFFPWYEMKEYALKLPEDESALGEIRTDVHAYFDNLEKELGRKFPLPQRYWYSKKKEELGEKVKEQFPSTPEEAFLSSGSKLFDSENLRVKLANEPAPPINVVEGVEIFVPYKRGHRYGLGADVAAGIGRHSSTIGVIDFTTGETVASFVSDEIAPDALAHKIAFIGNMYGTCVAAPENNNMGHTTVTILRDIYPNIFRSVLKGYVEDKPTTRLGWSTNSSSKSLMMYDLAQGFLEGSIVCRDRRVLLEARLFNKEDALVLDKKAITKHYDLLSAYAIAYQMRAYAGVSFEDSETVSRVEVRRSLHRAGVNNFN